MTTFNSPDSQGKSAVEYSSSNLETVKAELAAVRRRLNWLTVGVFLAALAQLLWVAAVYAAEIDFHYGEYKLIAGACTGGVLMGFLFGWLARRAV